MPSRICSTELEPAERDGVRLTELALVLMGPTRKRDLTAATVLAAVVGLPARGAAVPLVSADRRCGPGLSLLAVAIAEGGWAFYVRAKINDGEIGDARGWLHPLAVARSVLIAKASAWVGALVLGWWIARAGLSFAAPRHAAGGRRGHRGSGRGRGRARSRWWSPRYGFSIAASRRKSRRTTPTGRPSS